MALKINSINYWFYDHQSRVGQNTRSVLTSFIYIYILYQAERKNILFLDPLKNYESITTFYLQGQKLTGLTMYKKIFPLETSICSIHCCLFLYCLSFINDKTAYFFY